jgi:hypothetical protein
MNAVTKDYGVFGDYGWSKETLLMQTDSQWGAIRWAEGYTHNGQTGGYNAVEVVSMIDEQSEQIVWTFEAKLEVDEEDEGMLYDEP